MESALAGSCLHFPDVLQESEGRKRNHFPFSDKFAGTYKSPGTDLPGPAHILGLSKKYRQLFVISTVVEFMTILYPQKAGMKVFTN
jgi:hypothetical protein